MFMQLSVWLWGWPDDLRVQNSENKDNVALKSQQQSHLASSDDAFLLSGSVQSSRFTLE